MNDKKTWSAATLIGGGLDGLMILAALDRIEEKLSAIQEKMRSRKRGHRGRCPGETAATEPSS